MKKIIIALLFLLPLALKAQTRDTTYKTFPSCKIVPIYIRVPGLDSLQSERIQISYFAADFASKTVEIHYSFCRLDGTLIYSGIDYLKELDIDNLPTNQILPAIFIYLGGKLKIQYL